MPLAPTPAQSAASRANGALSRGPATPGGRARAALNGTRHNLSGAFRLLAHEDPAEHRALLAGYVARHKPVDEAEGFWVGRLVAAAWRLRRLEDLEAVVLAAADAGTSEPDQRLPSPATLVRYRARVDRDHRHALAELERLRACRPRLHPSIAFAAGNAEALRWIADRAEEDAAAAAAGGGTGEPEPPATLDAAAEPPTAAPAGAPAAGPGTTEPEAARHHHLNRAQRRRLEALRRRKRAA